MEPPAPDPPHGAGCPLSRRDPSVAFQLSDPEPSPWGDANILALLKKNNNNT